MPPLPLAARLSTLSPSATVTITDRARRLRAEGQDVLSFSVGEPDFEPPAHVVEAAAAAARDGRASKYTAARGIPELRAAICEDSARRRGGVRHSPEEVVVSAGAKHSLFNLACCLFEPGDEVIIPAPYWVSYPDQVKLMGGTPVIVETRAETGYLLTADALREALSPRTKALLLCSPSNPTGAAYTRAALGELAEVLREHRCYVVVDEIYAQLVYGGFTQSSLLEVAPDLRERLIVVDGVSKSYAMTGYRIGWMLAPRAIASAAEKLQAQSTTNPAASSQWAAVAALEGPRDHLETMRDALDRRRSFVLSQLVDIEGLSCRPPEGAFYAFADVRGVLARGVGGRSLGSDLELCEYLLEVAHVALVPGTAFGAPGHLRMSYTASDAALREGLRRIKDALR